MDKLSKVLDKLTIEERAAIKAVLLKIHEGKFSELDIKKLKGRDDVFRVRKGKIRIIFLKTKEEIRILSLERRSDNTYN